MQRLTSEWYMVHIIHSFKKYFTECLYVPGTILGINGDQDTISKMLTVCGEGKKGNRQLHYSEIGSKTRVVDSTWKFHSERKME